MVFEVIEATQTLEKNFDENVQTGINTPQGHVIGQYILYDNGILKLKTIYKYPFLLHIQKIVFNATIHCIAMSTSTYKNMEYLQQLKIFV